MDIDPYAVLAVPKDATLPEIKSAHRKLVLKCHPDKIKDESLRNEAQDQFQRVQQAYELLSDPSRRTKYD
ncbi:J domain-containing protein, partial [Aspergillus glaucus CBS 516.65]